MVKKIWSPLKQKFHFVHLTLQSRLTTQLSILSLCKHLCHYHHLPRRWTHHCTLIMSNAVFTAHLKYPSILSQFQSRFKTSHLQFRSKFKTSHAHYLWTSLDQYMRFLLPFFTVYQFKYCQVHTAIVWVAQSQSLYLLLLLDSSICKTLTYSRHGAIQ